MVVLVLLKKEQKPWGHRVIKLRPKHNKNRTYASIIDKIKTNNVNCISIQFAKLALWFIILLIFMIQFMFWDACFTFGLKFLEKAKKMGILFSMAPFFAKGAAVAKPLASTVTNSVLSSQVDSTITEQNISPTTSGSTSPVPGFSTETSPNTSPSSSKNTSPINSRSNSPTNSSPGNIKPSWEIGNKKDTFLETQKKAMLDKTLDKTLDLKSTPIIFTNTETTQDVISRRNAIMKVIENEDDRIIKTQRVSASYLSSQNNNTNANDNFNSSNFSNDNDNFNNDDSNNDNIINNKLVLYTQPEKPLIPYIADKKSFITVSKPNLGDVVKFKKTKIFDNTHQISGSDQNPEVYYMYPLKSLTTGQGIISPTQEDLNNLVNYLHTKAIILVSPFVDTKFSLSINYKACLTGAVILSIRQGISIEESIMLGCYAIGHSGTNINFMQWLTKSKIVGTKLLNICKYLPEETYNALSNSLKNELQALRVHRIKLHSELHSIGQINQNADFCFTPLDDRPGKKVIPFANLLQNLSGNLNPDAVRVVKVFTDEILQMVAQFYDEKNRVGKMETKNHIRPATSEELGTRTKDALYCLVKKLHHWRDYEATNKHAIKEGNKLLEDLKLILYHYMNEKDDATQFVSNYNYLNAKYINFLTNNKIPMNLITELDISNIPNIQPQNLIRFRVFFEQLYYDKHSFWFSYARRVTHQKDITNVNEFILDFLEYLWTKPF